MEDERGELSRQQYCIHAKEFRAAGTVCLDRGSLYVYIGRF